MNASRLKEIARMAKRATPDKLHDLYMEVYGADFAGKVTLDRARASIQEACKELLTRAGKELPDFDPIAPSVPGELAEPPPVKGKKLLSPEHVTAPRPGRVRKHRTLEPL